MAKTSLTARLETLPFTKKHTRLLGVTGVLFAVFAAAFLLAAVTTFALPEKRGKSL